MRRAHEALNTQCIIHKLKLYGLVHEQGHVGIPGGPFKIYTPSDLDFDGVSSKAYGNFRFAYCFLH